VPIYAGPVVDGLCTLAEVKSQLNKTSTADDVELQSYIDAVTAPIEGFCGAILPVTVTDPITNPNGSVYVVRAARLASVTSVTEYQGTTAVAYTEAADPTAAGSYTYMVDPSLNGIIARLGASGAEQRFGGPLKVVYIAGFAVIPANINLAARILVQALWETQNGGAGLPSLADEMAVQAVITETLRSPRVLMLLAPYQRGPWVA